MMDGWDEIFAGEKTGEQQIKTGSRSRVHAETMRSETNTRIYRQNR
jgi:hypothetical protein